jgi:hypothetical protein
MRATVGDELTDKNSLLPITTIESLEENREPSIKTEKLDEAGDCGCHEEQGGKKQHSPGGLNFVGFLFVCGGVDGAVNIRLDGVVIENAVIELGGSHGVYPPVCVAFLFTNITDFYEM